MACVYVGLFSFSVASIVLIGWILGVGFGAAARQTAAVDRARHTGIHRQKTGRGAACRTAQGGEMEPVEAVGMLIVVVFVSVFGVWIGIAMGLDACAQNGSYKHPMLTVEVHCEVRK